MKRSEFVFLSGVWVPNFIYREFDLAGVHKSDNKVVQVVSFETNEVMNLEIPVMFEYTKTGKKVDNEFEYKLTKVSYLF